VKVAGRRLELTDEMVQVEPGRGGKLVSKDATIPYALSFRYEDEGEGTKLIWHQEMESLKGFFKFADAIVLKLYARDVRSNLEKAKTILGHEGAPAGGDLTHLFAAEASLRAHDQRHQRSRFTVLLLRRAIPRATSRSRTGYRRDLA